MASRLLTKGVTRKVFYLQNLKEAVKHFRTFSSYNSGEPTEPRLVIEEAVTESVWPDHQLGPLGPTDKRFPLPGLVGPLPRPGPARIIALDPINPNDLFKQMATERHMTVFQQAQEGLQELEALSPANSLSPDAQLECVIQTCPRIMRKDFADLFPDQNIMEGNFTIISVSQKTKYDMTSWSEDVGLEREDLLESFVLGASEICEALKSAGYWADFIDPSSGKPYIGAHTTSTMFETDERYRKLGFEIDDLGCCKVIRHHIWGTRAYVGCLFTNAPSDHPILSARAGNFNEWMH